MTPAERRAALDEIAAEVRACTRCRLHETRTNAVPGEGHPDTEVMFVGEGPGFHEDRLGRPFVGRAGDFLVRLLGSVEWRRDEVFITNIVKCRPPENRDPEPDEIAACAPFLRRQLEVLDPAVVVTLGRHSMARFMPGARISQAHGTTRMADPATGAADATVFAMYHPAAALRTPAVAEESFRDIAHVPDVLLAARDRRRVHEVAAAAVLESAAGPPVESTVVVAEPPVVAAPPVEQPLVAELPGPAEPEPAATPSGATEAGTAVGVLAATSSAPAASAPALPSAEGEPAASPPAVDATPSDQLSLF